MSALFVHPQRHKHAHARTLKHTAQTHGQRVKGITKLIIQNTSKLMESGQFGDGGFAIITRCVFCRFMGTAKIIRPAGSGQNSTCGVET